MPQGRRAAGGDRARGARKHGPGGRVPAGPHADASLGRAVAHASPTGPAVRACAHACARTQITLQRDAGARRPSDLTRARAARPHIAVRTLKQRRATSRRPETGLTNLQGESARQIHAINSCPGGLLNRRGQAGELFGLTDHTNANGSDRARAASGPEPAWPPGLTQGGGGATDARGQGAGENHRPPKSNTSLRREPRTRKRRPPVAPRPSSPGRPRAGPLGTPGTVRSQPAKARAPGHCPCRAPDPGPPRRRLQLRTNGQRPRLLSGTAGPLAACSPRPRARHPALPQRPAPRVPPAALRGGSQPQDVAPQLPGLAQTKSVSKRAGGDSGGSRWRCRKQTRTVARRRGGPQHPLAPWPLPSPSAHGAARHPGRDTDARARRRPRPSRTPPPAARPPVRRAD